MKQFILGGLLFVAGQQSATTPASPVPPQPQVVAERGSGVNFFLQRQDIEIGAESAAEAEKQLSIIQSPPLNQYIRSIAQRLLAKQEPTLLRHRFHIVNSDEINSMAFPNGTVFLYRGLLEVTGSEDEIAAIIAHELGHLQSRHATEQLSRQLLVQEPLTIASGLLSGDNWKDHLSRLGVSFGVRASFLHYGRDQEIQANALARGLLEQAHFDPNAFETVVGKVSHAATSGNMRPIFLYNHPALSPRAESPAVDETEAVDVVGAARVVNADFQNFHARLERLPRPVLPEETPAPTPNEIVPMTYRHPLEYYSLCHPEGWLVTQTGSNGAIIAPIDGVHVSRVGEEVTRGVMFDIFDLADRQLTLEGATNRLIVYLRQRNQGLRLVPGAQTPILVHDEPGLRTVLIGKSGATDSEEVVWVVTRMYYQNLFYIVLVAPESDFRTYQPVFEEVIRSIQMR